MAKRRSKRKSIKRLLRKKKWIIPAAILVLVVLIVGVVLIVTDLQHQNDMHLTASGDAYVGSGYRDVVWNGDHYRYNNRLTAILVAGLDSEGKVGETVKYSLAPRADSIQMVLLDQKTHKMKILALNRDTMTDVRKYTIDGKDRGLMRDHLAMSFSYGNGGVVSCQDLCEAVSLLLYNIPIRDYVIVNRTSLKTLAELVGPVQVTVPNDDLAEYGDQYREGEVVTIDADNIELYVRSRDIEIEKSNLGRMQRQESYISAAMDQIMAEVKDNPSGVWNDMQKAEDCMLTSLNRNRYLDLVKILQDVTYSSEDYIVPAGEQVMTDVYEEFYPDQEELLKTVIDLFYIKQ